MIYFATEHSEVYNKIIHGFLWRDIFSKADIDIGDVIEEIMPKYLRREQYAKCEKTMIELYEWTGDVFEHEMSCFHELMLNNYLDSLAELKDDLENFNDIFFDEETKKMIHEASKADYEAYGKEEDMSLEEIEDSFYNPYCYADFLFTDLDFQFLDYLYNEQKHNLPVIAKNLGINLDYYFDMLPMDIQNKYKSHNITLTGEVSELLSFIQKTITNGSLSKLFWEKDVPISETKIQIILENLMEAYFYNKGVDITREALVASGEIDFKLYKNNVENEKILIEVKKASNPYWKSGYENQLIEYIRTCGCTNAFYLIVCFTDKEYEKAVNFIKNNVYTDNYQMYINISILDVRKKVPASKRKTSY